MIFCSDSLLHQCVLTLTRFLVTQHPSLLNMIFNKFPHLIAPISIHPPFGKSGHAHFYWAITSSPTPSRPDKLNPAHINCDAVWRFQFSQQGHALFVWPSTNSEFAIQFLEILFHAMPFGKCHVFTT